MSGPVDPERAHAARLSASAPRRTTAADHPHVVRLLADAFTEDPLMSWGFREGSGHDRALTTYFDFAVSKQCAPFDATFMAADGNAAAVWLPPAGLASLSIPPSSMLRMLPMFLKLFGWSRIARGIAMGDAMEKHHPPEPPHWYLFFIGVAPQMRGLGLGSAILEATLKHADAEGMPAYLDNSNPRNTRLYERHGFRIVSEYRPRKDSPPLWGMWRDARKP
jgi:GNAT superfamily N-acetyltransferase